MMSGLFGGDIEQSQFHVRLFFQAIKTTLVVEGFHFFDFLDSHGSTSKEQASTTRVT